MQHRQGVILDYGEVPSILEAINNVKRTKHISGRSQVTYDEVTV